MQFDPFIRKERERAIDRIAVHEKDGVLFLSFPLLDQYDFLLNAFSTRIGGVSTGCLDSMNLTLPREVLEGRPATRELSIALRKAEEDRGKAMSCGTDDTPGGGLEEIAFRNAGADKGRPEAGRGGKGPAGMDQGDQEAGGTSEGALPSGEKIQAAMDRFVENHRRFSSAVGYDMRNTVFSDQTHTDTVAEVTGKDRGNGLMYRNKMRDVDGLMTDRRQVALMTFYADCVPLLLVDPEHKAIACVHSGWRGTVKDIGGQTVKKMQERYGSDPREIRAAIGPSICQDCYEVSREVGDHFRRVYPEEVWGRILREGRPGHEMLDLWEACRYNFLRAGLLYDHVSVPDLCTCCNKNLLFSHRGSRGFRGNLAAVLMLR